jgi:hypothetical protein
MFEKIILSRMLDWENESKSLKPQQFEFRAKHSTTLQVLRIAEAVSIRFDNDKSTAMILLDIEKAFDSVWHDALRHKILLYKFSIYLTKIISSFLVERKSFISIGNSVSSTFSIPAWCAARLSYLSISFQHFHK